MPRARVGDIDLYYLLSGKADGEAVVLISGFSAPLEMWAPTMPALVDQYRVLTYDLRGHGRSDAPFGGYDLATQAEDMIGLMDQLGIGAAHVVGDAAGGCLAVEAALRWPERVKSLALIGARIVGWQPPAEALDPPSAEEQAYNAEFQRRYKEEGLPEILEQWWLGDWAKPMRDDPIQRRAARFRDLILSYPAGAWQATLPPRQVEPHYPRLGELRMPTLVMYGGGDLQIIKLDAEEYLRVLPNARRSVIPDSGHIPNWEFPEVFNRELVAFLGEVS